VKLASISEAAVRTVLTTIAITGVGFIASVITARVLGPEGRGLLSAALLICTLSAGIAQMGLANSFVYHRGARREFDYVRLLWCSVVVVPIVAVLLALAGVHLTAHPRIEQGVALILGAAAFTAIYSYLNTLAMLRADLLFYNVLRSSFVFGNLAVLLLAVLALGRDVQFEHILALQLVVLAALTVLGLVWAARRAVTAAQPEASAQAGMKEILSYGLHHHGTVVLGLLLIHIDKVVLLARGSMAEFGLYAVAFATSRLIGAVQDAVSTALYAGLAGTDVAAMSAKIGTAFRATFVPMLVVAAIGAALAPWLVQLVYGSEFAAMSAPFAVLLFECVIGGASWTLAQRFNAAGRPGIVFLRQSVSVLPVLVALPFLPQSTLPLCLSLLMLCGAILRLVATIVLYPVALKEAMPRLWPTRGDCRALCIKLRISSV
jgi:O-antigen/teichoic acid export membrane protein